MSVGKYDFKIVKSGLNIEVHHYLKKEKERRYKTTFDEDTGEIKREFWGWSPKRAKKKEEDKDKKDKLNPMSEAEKKYKNMRDTVKKGRDKVRRLIDANLFAWGFPVFVTLTYEENMLDREVALSDFDNFTKRLCYNLGRDAKEKKRKWLKYLAVIENQTERGEKNGDEGALHFHIVFFNLPYIWFDDLLKVWGKGGGWINKIDKDDYSKVAKYMTKYMSKQLDYEEIMGQKKKKRFLPSHKLIKPEIILFEEKEKEELGRFLEDYSIMFETEYENEHTGKVLYKHLTLKKDVYRDFLNRTNSKDNTIIHDSNKKYYKEIKLDA